MSNWFKLAFEWMQIHCQQYWNSSLCLFINCAHNTFLWFMYCKINRSNLSIAEKANQLIIQYKSYKKPTKNPHRIDLPLSFRTVIMALAFYPQHIGKKKMLWGEKCICAKWFYISPRLAHHSNLGQYRVVNEATLPLLFK